MHKFLILLGLLFIYDQASWAGEVPQELAEAPYRFKTNHLMKLRWKPSIYPEDGAVYDVLYYLPKKLKRKRNYPNGFPALVFLHGGGSSTTTPEGSLNAIHRYISRLIRVADTLQIALVLPSGTGMNWGTHTPYYMRSLIKMIRNSLNVNADKIGIAGHSMGGMAMTRIFQDVGDQVAFVFSLAAGAATLDEINLRTHFNTPYLHITGLKDEFDVFITRCIAHKRAVEVLEEKYSQKSKFKMELTVDDHSSVLMKMIPRLKELYESPRDLYQPKLFGQLTSQINRVEQDVNQKITIFPRNQYFWLEATEFADGPISTIPFVAEVKDNVFNINFDDPAETPKQLHVFLSSKMVDFSKTIQVYVNGKLTATREAAAMAEQVQVKTFSDLYQDKGFEFEEKIDIKIQSNNPNNSGRSPF